MASAAHAPPVPGAPPEAVCIICLDRGDEPLLRNCACRGPTAGFAHMSCLVRYVSSNSLALSRELSRRGPHAPGYEVKAPSNVAPITRPLVG